MLTAIPYASQVSFIVEALGNAGLDDPELYAAASALVVPKVRAGFQETTADRQAGRHERRSLNMSRVCWEYSVVRSCMQRPASSPLQAVATVRACRQSTVVTV